VWACLPDRSRRRMWSSSRVGSKMRVLRGDRGYPDHLVMAAQQGRWAFVVMDDDEAVGLVDVECDSDDPSIAAVGMVVAPARRGLGIGRRLLSAVSARPELAAVEQLVGEVEEGNVAAVKCVVAAGFKCEGAAGDAGFTRYVLHLR
jgi:ribosomal protein S18 acetylase RimI-like enzyme